MQTIRNILKISPAGTMLSDEYGSSSGISLEFTLGTALRLEFDLRQEYGQNSSVLPVYPLDKLLSGAYYCALDLECNYSDSPLLLQVSGITLSTDSDGHSVFAVEIPDTAVEKMVAALRGKSSCRMLCEIGGLNDEAVAVFAWHFEITVHNRVFAGSGSPSVAGDPEYYTSVQVEAAIARELIFEYSADGTHWHRGCTSEDLFLRVRHGENGTPSGSVSLAVASRDNNVLEDVPVSAVDGIWNLDVEPNCRYILASGGEELVVGNIAESSLESEIWIPAAAIPVTVSFPSALGWIGEPSFEAGKSYIINIRHNVAVCSEYTPGVE